MFCYHPVFLQPGEFMEQIKSLQASIGPKVTPKKQGDESKFLILYILER